MFYTVYKITNKINGKTYVGKHQTKDLNDGYMGSGKHLKNSITKYGIENFEKEILFQFDNEVEMNAKEAELVTEEFCLREDTYNLCPGGKGGWGYINSIPRSEKQRETARKQIAINSNHEKSINTQREKQIGCFNPSANFTFAGRKHSDETRQKMRKSKNVGESHSQYGTIWITNGIDNAKLCKDSPIPDGWVKGRKMKSK